MSTVAQHETEYSKKWVAENPWAFTKTVLDFIEQFPSDRWTICVTQTKGRFTLRATPKAE